MDSNLIYFLAAYFHSKNIPFIHTYLCSKYDTLALAHNFRVMKGGADAMTAFNFRAGVVFDIDCPEAEILLKQFEAKRVFSSRLSWLLVSSAYYNESSVTDLLQDADILPDSDFVGLFNGTLIEFYRPALSHSIIATGLPLSVYDNMETISKYWRSRPAIVTRRRNLQNVYVKAGLILTHPELFVSWSDQRLRQYDIHPKITYPLVMLLAEDLHIRYDIRQVDIYGVDSNGSFNGLVGLIQRREVELGLTSVFMRADRWNVLDYAAETIELNAGFLFRAPSQSSVQNVFVEPLVVSVWYGVLSVYVASGLLVWLTGWLLANHRPLLAPLTPGEAFTFTIGAASQQGFFLSPASWAMRGTMWVTLVFSVFIFTSYSAKIVTILQTPSHSIRSLADITNSPMSCAVQESTYKRVFFQESSDAVTKEFYKRKLVPLGDKAYLTVEDGMSRVKQGMFAFQVEHWPAYDVMAATFTESEKCSVREISAYKMPMVSLPTVKYSGYKDHIAARLRWQRETGLMSRTASVWTRGAGKCAGAQSQFSSVQLGDILPVLQVFFCGTFIAVSILIVEYAVFVLTKELKKRMKRIPYTE